MVVEYVAVAVDAAVDAGVVRVRSLGPWRCKTGRWRCRVAVQAQQAPREDYLLSSCHLIKGDSWLWSCQRSRGRALDMSAA